VLHCCSVTAKNNKSQEVTAVKNVNPDAYAIR